MIPELRAKERLTEKEKTEVMTIEREETEKGGEQESS